MEISNEAEKLFAFSLPHPSDINIILLPQHPQVESISLPLLLLPLFLMSFCSAYLDGFLIPHSPQAYQFFDTFVNKVIESHPNNVNMSKRPSSDRQPSGLIKALDGLGRTRGSSATPVQSGLLMLSPQPQRDLQAQIENMNSDMRRATIIQGNPDQNVVLANRTGSMLQKQGGVRHQRGQSSSTRSGASTQEQGVKIGHHARELSLNAYQSNSIQDMGFSSAAADPGTFQFPRRQGGSLHESSCVSFSSSDETLINTDGYYSVWLSMSWQQNFKRSLLSCSK